MEAEDKEPTIAIEAGRCTHDNLGCACGGAGAVSADRSQEIGDARSAELVECPECGELSSPHPVATWGHCRVCRTADSRSKSPLRW